MPGLRFLAPWGLLGLSLTPSAGEVYTYTTIDARDTPCTNRCASIEATGAWRCDDVTDATGAIVSVCNTFELSSKACHFHQYTQAEVGQCMTSQGMDFIFMGASHQNGMMSSVFPWFDPTLAQTVDTFQVLDWLGTDTSALGSAVAHAWDTGCAQLSINSAGAITWKGADAEFIAAVQTPACQTILSRAPLPVAGGDSYMTYAQARSFTKAHEALDQLAAAGRANRKAILMSGIGPWFQNCWDQGTIAAGDFDYCAASTYPEGPTVKAFKDAKDRTGFFAWYMNEMTIFGDRLKTEFPNYQYIVYDNAYDATQGHINQQVGDMYAGYVAVHDMEMAVNAPPMVDFHDIHSVNMMVFQRVLSVACKDIHPALVECGEELIGNSQCQWNDGLDTLPNPWSDQWNRPCQLASVMSAKTFDTTGQAPLTDVELLKLSTAAGTATGTKSAGGRDDNQIVLETSPIAKYASAAEAATASAATTDTVTYKAWDYNTSQIVMAIIGGVFVAYIYSISSDSGERLTSKERRLRSKQSAVAGSNIKKSCCTRVWDCFVAPSTTATPGSKADDGWGSIKSLLGARYLASLHVVAGHYGNLSPQVVPNWYVMFWGFTWVPWFMMVSGFILTHTSFKKQSRTGKEGARVPAAQFMLARVMSIYPIYFLSLMCAYVVAFSNDTWKNITWLEVFCSLTLTQAWTVTITEQVVQAQCWFLSAIVVLWFGHGYMERFFSKLSIGKIWASCAGVFFIGWLPAIIPMMIGAPEDWYTGHAWGATGSWLDIFVVMLKFHPLFYVHIYGFGILLACLFRHYRANPPIFLKYGALIGYIGLFCIFIDERLQPPAYKLTCRLGLLAPLHGLIMLGLAFGKDPLCRLLGSWVFIVLGTYSYAQYCFQYIAIDAWEGWADFGEIIFLMAMAMCATVVSVMMFGGKTKKRFMQGMVCVVVWAMLALVVWCMMPTIVTDDWLGKTTLTIDPSEVPITSTPSVAYVNYGGGAYDVRLNLTSDQSLLGGSPVYAIINPSVLQDSDGKMYIAARRHRMDYDTTPKKMLNGYPVTTTEWYSDIVFGQLHPQTLLPVGALKVLDFTATTGDAAGKPWMPCAQVPVFNAANGTYTQHVVTGPQDPRLMLQADGTLTMTFFSTTPVAQSGYWCNQAGTIGRMYTTVGDLKQAGMLANLIPAVPIAAPSDRLAPTDQQTYEKNWMALQFGLQTRYIQHLSPYTAFKTTAADPTVIVQTEPVVAGPLDYISQSMQVDVHGGSNAIYVVSIFEDTYILTAFHTLNAEGQYVNYLAKITAQVPFGVVAISRPLPLLSSNPENCPIFASGLSAHYTDDAGFLVTYGACDEESRAMRFTYNDLNTLFTHTQSKDGGWAGGSSTSAVGIGDYPTKVLDYQEMVKENSNPDLTDDYFSAFITTLSFTVAFYCYLFHAAWKKEQQARESLKMINDYRPGQDYSQVQKAAPVKAAPVEAAPAEAAPVAKAAVFEGQREVTVAPLDAIEGEPYQDVDLSVTPRGRHV